MKFVVAGEALVDIVPGGAGGADSAGAVEMPGGSPANVAVTLGRLGRSPALATVLANDSRGRMVKDWLEASGVEVVAAAPSNGRTSTAKVVLDDAGVASYDFDLTWDLPVSHLIPLISGSEPGVFHVGSIATVLAPGDAALASAMKQARGQMVVSFDPNARPAITPDVDATRLQVEHLIGLSDLVKVSEEDLAWYYPGIDPAAAARRWVQAGPSVVVITLGGDGAVAVRAGGSELRIPGVPVSVSDTIGAGDTFMGALLDGLATAGVTDRATLDSLSDDALRTALKWAAKAAAITCSRPGANPPTRAELL